MRLTPPSFSQVTLFLLMAPAKDNTWPSLREATFSRHSSSKFFPARLCTRGSMSLSFSFCFSDALRACPQNHFPLSLSFIRHNHHPHHSFVELSITFFVCIATSLVASCSAHCKDVCVACLPYLIPTPESALPNASLFLCGFLPATRICSHSISYCPGPELFPVAWKALPSQQRAPAGSRGQRSGGMRL